MGRGARLSARHSVGESSTSRTRRANPSGVKGLARKPKRPVLMIDCAGLAADAGLEVAEDAKPTES